jgi:hypothetical protein
MIEVLPCLKELRSLFLGGITDIPSAGSRFFFDSFMKQVVWQIVVEWQNVKQPTERENR